MVSSLFSDLRVPHTNPGQHSGIWVIPARTLNGPDIPAQGYNPGAQSRHACALKGLDTNPRLQPDAMARHASALNGLDIPAQGYNLMRWQDMPVP